MGRTDKERYTTRKNKTERERTRVKENKWDTKQEIIREHQKYLVSATTYLVKQETRCIARTLNTKRGRTKQTKGTR